jgi:TIR domain
MPYLVFISHSGQDTWIAEKLSSDCERADASTFLDEARIAIGAKFEDEILEALRKADEIVVLITPWALERSYVWLEIGAAWLRGIPIIVILLGISAKEFQEKLNVPIALKERNLIPLNQCSRYISELRQRTKGTTT